MIQRNLFDDALPDEPEPPAQPHSPTSQQAAESMRGTTGRLRQEVLAFVRSQGESGATDEEMQKSLGMNPSTQRPRRIELVRQGLIVDSGRTRPTTTGRNAVVWVAVRLIHCL